jgi:DNA-binding transcriptional MerR regulator
MTVPPGATVELRVEDLAERAGTSIDTIRFYQKRRLLDPPEKVGRVGVYGEAHVERLERIRDLRRLGLTLALIERVLHGDLDATDAPLAAAVAAAEVAATGEATGTEEFFTLDELAERCGVPTALLATVVDAQLLVARRHDGEPRFTAADADIISSATALLGTGIPFGELLDLARAHDTATRATAERAVELFDAHIRAPLRASALTDDERATRLVEAFRVMLPAVTHLVAHHFRRVLLEIAQDHLDRVGEQAELLAAQAEGTRRIEGAARG